MTPHRRTPWRMVWQTATYRTLGNVHVLVIEVFRGADGGRLGTAG